MCSLDGASHSAPFLHLGAETTKDKERHSRVGEANISLLPLFRVFCAPSNARNGPSKKRTPRDLRNVAGDIVARTYSAGHNKDRKRDKFTMMSDLGRYFGSISRSTSMARTDTAMKNGEAMTGIYENANW